jgi:hypothetical protein
MLKLVALVALFAGFCWFGTQVPLGSHTLFGHLHAIAGTKESQDLFDGTRESAQPLVNDVRRRIAGAAEPKSGTTTGTKSGTTPAPKSEARSDGEETDRATTAAGGRPDAGPPQERLTASERRRLRRLISSAEGISARP